MVEWFGQWVAVGWLAHAGGGEGGVAAEPCAPAAGGPWYLPDGTTDVDGDDDYLIVMNPFAREAVFSISLLSERKEPVRHGSLTDVVLRPFRSAAFNVHDVVLGEPTVSALVEVSVGRVAAATLGISGAGGIRAALGYLGQPADTLTFPGGDDAGRAAGERAAKGDGRARGHDHRRVEDDERNHPQRLRNYRNDGAHRHGANDVAERWNE